MSIPDPSPDHAPAGGAGRTFLPFETPVRGHAFAASPPAAGPLQPGMEVALRREPGHPVDPWAVGCWVDDDGAPWRIGYLDRGVAARLAPRLDRGMVEVRARLAGWQDEPLGRWRRPIVALRPLVAPAARDGRPLAREERSVWGTPPRSVTRRRR